MTALGLDSPTNRRAIPAPSPTRIAIYAAAVLGLRWLGPLIDHAAGHGIGEGPGQLIWILLLPCSTPDTLWKPQRPVRDPSCPFSVSAQCPLPVLLPERERPRSG